MISVIIPVYNAEKSIESCINAFFNQSYEGEYELIVVDDGSTDKTFEIIKKYARDYPKIIRVLHQKHNGPAAARNLGAKYAKGNIILFTDADCVPHKDWISEMIKPFKDKEIVGVQGRYKSIQKSLIARFVQLEIEDRYDKMRKYKYIDFVGSYSAGYRKDIFLKIGGFDEHFKIPSGEDSELSFRLHKMKYRMVFNPNAIVYHLHPNGVYKYFKQKFYRAFWRVLIYKKYKNKIIKDTYTPQILKFQIILFYLLFISLVCSLFIRSFINITGITLILFFITTIKFSIKNFKKDKLVGIITPFMVFLRAFAFSFGLIFGILKNWRTI